MTYNDSTKKVSIIKEKIQTCHRAMKDAEKDAFSAADARKRMVKWCHTFELPMRAVRMSEAIEDLEWELEIAIREARTVLIQDMRAAVDALEAGDYLNDCLANIEDITQELNKVGV